MEDVLVYEDIITIYNEKTINEIARQIGTDHCSLATQEQIDAESLNPAILGVLYSHQYQPFVNLLISSKKHNKKITTVFLIDPNSPRSYVSYKTMEALGFAESPETTDIWFRDSVHFVFQSPYNDPLEEVNVIGSDILRNCRATLHLDYLRNEVTLSTS